MSNLSVRHNLTDDELIKAVAGMATAAGISEEVCTCLEKGRKEDVAVSLSRDPYIAELVGEMHILYQDAIVWIKNFLDDYLTQEKKESLLRKSKVPLARPLTVKELREIQQAIRAKFEHIAVSISDDPDVDVAMLKRWKKLGIVDKSVTPADLIGGNQKLLRNAFVYGRMAMAVEHGGDFSEIIKVALSAPLSKPNMMALMVAEQRAAQGIVRFGNMLSDIATDQARAKVRSMVVDIHAQTLIASPASAIARQDKRVETWQEFSSELYHTMEDKARDWDRIAFYELNDTKKYGKAVGLVQKYGPEQMVYKSPLPTACAQCRALYLHADGHPNLFKLGDMIQNGDNIGKKPMPQRKGNVVSASRPDGAATYDAVAGLVHPYCQCVGPNIFTGMEWWADGVQARQ
jgi:hypothetical protein